MVVPSVCSLSYVRSRKSYLLGKEVKDEVIETVLLR